jgi:hypothetical protein
LAGNGLGVGWERTRELAWERTGEAGMRGEHALGTPLHGVCVGC